MNKTVFSFEHFLKTQSFAQIGLNTTNYERTGKIRHTLSNYRCSQFAPHSTYCDTLAHTVGKVILINNFSTELLFVLGNFSFQQYHRI